MRRAASAVVALGVTVATLGYALWDTDLARLWQTLATGRIWILFPFLLVLAVFYLTNAQRWTRMLRPFGDFSARQVLPSMMIGFAGNNVLPFRVGEFIRAYLFAKEYGQSKSGVLMTLVLERLLDLIGILAIYALGLLFLSDAPAVFRASAWLAALGIAFVTAVVLAFLFLPEPINRLWLGVGASLPAGVRERGSVYLAQFRQGLGTLRDSATSLLLIVQSVGRWLLAGLLAWLCVYAYGDPIPFPLAMVVIGVTAFAVSLPSAPGFVGPIQAAFVFALEPFGVARETALAASILFLLGHWVPVTAVGATMLASRHLSFRQLEQEVDQREGF